MDKKWMILMCIFSVLTFISSIVCSCFIFFSEKSRIEAASQEVLANSNTYKSTSIVYYNNNTMNLSDLSPGFSNEQTFSITNNNSNPIIYSIEWKDVTSTWNYSSDDTTTHPEEFVYSIKCSNGENKENISMPINGEDAIILDNLELKTNRTNTCNIKISFIEKDNDQSYNLNKLFRGTYKVIVKE